MTTEEKTHVVIFLIKVIVVSVVSYILLQRFGRMAFLGYFLGGLTVLFCMLLDTL